MAQKNKQFRHYQPPPPAVITLPKASQLWAWIGIGWAVAITCLYWNRFSWIASPLNFPPLSNAPTQWSVFLQDGVALFLMITCVAGSTAFGSYLLRMFHLSWHSSLEEKVFSMGFGLAAVGYVILALGLVQLFRPPVFWALWGAGLILAWKRWFQGRGFSHVDAWALRLNRWHSAHLSWWPQIAMLWAMLILACVMAFVPEVFYDSMVYHLGVPNWYLHEGGIKYYPSFHSQFPFLRQMLNVWGLALNGERLAKLLHASSGPLLIATFYVLAKRYSYPKTAIVAALALFSMPMVNMILWTAGIDVGMSTFALLAFLAWLNGLTQPDLRTRWFTLAGVFGGFCFSSKYPGLVLVFCMSLTTLVWLGAHEKNWIAGLRESLRIGVVACLVTLPWLLKTWAFTGNPVYPYLSTIFKTRDLLPDRVLVFLADTGTGAKHELLPLLTTPWTQTFTDISSFASPGVFLLGFLVFLAAGLFRKDARHPGFVPAAIFFGIYWFCINAMTDRIRLGIPGIAIGCYILAHPAGYFYERGGKVLQTALAIVVAVAGLTGILSTLPTIARSYLPLDVLAGRETAEAYLSYTHPGMDPYPATSMFVEAKKIVPPGHRMLIVGDEKTSPCPVPFLASGVHNNSLLVQWSLESQNEDDLVKRFNENKVSHVMINVADAQRLLSYRMLNWDDRSFAISCAFFEHHLRLVKQTMIVEKFFQQQSPLLLYEFTAAPAATPAPDNIFMALYETLRFPESDPLAAQKRADMLEAVDRAYPNLSTVKRHIAYWRGRERAGHAP